MLGKSHALLNHRSFWLFEPARWAHRARMVLISIVHIERLRIEHLLALRRQTRRYIWRNHSIILVLSQSRLALHQHSVETWEVPVVHRSLHIRMRFLSGVTAMGRETMIYINGDAARVLHFVVVAAFIVSRAVRIFSPLRCLRRNVRGGAFICALKSLVVLLARLITPVLRVH